MTAQPQHRPGGEPVTPVAHHCAVCGRDAGPRLTVVPGCELHSHPDEAAAALNEQRDEMVLITTALKRWLAARDAAPVLVDENLTFTYRDSREYEEATDNLERVARRCFG